MLNIYAPSTDTPNYIKQILTYRKNQLGTNTIIMEDPNIPLSQIDSVDQTN